MPIDESIFTEDIEALDEDLEAVDEAADEGADEDLGEAVSNRRGNSRTFGGRGSSPSSGSFTRNSFNNVARGQQNLYGRVTTPAGVAKVEIPSSVASKKDLKGLTDGISRDMKQNQAAINSIKKSLNIADRNLSKNKTSLEKKVMALQLASLASLVIAPRLTSFTADDSGGGTEVTYTVKNTNYNYILPLIIAIAIPLMVNSSKGKGAAANIWPLVLILGVVVVANYTNILGNNSSSDSKTDSTGNFLSQNAPLIIVGIVILLTLTDSNIFG